MDVEMRRIPIETGRAFNAAHHSRLPYLQKGPWKYVFGAFTDGELLGVAFWHNCSARGLPKDWLELRRMAVLPGRKNLASYMLGWMARWFKSETSHPRLISYQDVSVHRGTIYKAAGWTPTHVSRPRQRDRSKMRRGTKRKYRTDANGPQPAASAKIRWEKSLIGERLGCLTVAQIDAARYMRPTL